MRKLKFLLLSIVLFINSCNGNMFKSISKQDSVEALYEEALKLTDSGSYDAAYTQLTAIAATDPSFASTDAFKKTLAGVQAGQCGLSFITFLMGISSASGGQIFSMFMQAFNGIAVTPQKCADAYTTMSTLSSLQDDQLLFLSILGMAKMGSYLRARADRDGTGNNGDGSTDATFDMCDATSAANRVSDDDMKQIISGFGLMLQNIGLIGGSFSGSSAETAIDNLNTFCTSSGINCNITDPTSSVIDAQLIRTFRRITNSSQYGIGTCDITEVNPGNAGFCCPALAIP